MAKTLELNDIASCDVIFEQKIFYEKYDDNKILGSFIVINPDTNVHVVPRRINMH